VLAAALLLPALPALAGGLNLYEIATVDLGLASAGYGARAQDASTVLTNPAGMMRLDGTQAAAGGQLLWGDASLSLKRNGNTASGGSGGNAIGWLPGASAFVSHTLSPDVKVGFGVAGNFGLAEEYNDNWAGRYYGKEATLLGISLLPSIAYRVDGQLSIGATINAMYGISDTKVAVNNLVPGLPDGQLTLDDRTWGWGVNVGALYQIDDDTRVGLTYNSQVNLDFKPKAEFSRLGPGLNAALSNRGLLNARIDLGVKVPQGLMASAYHRLDPQWAVLGSVGWQQWSRFGKVDVGVEGNDIKQTNLKLDNTWHIAAGAQFFQSPTRTYNFGIAYDSSFQDTGDVSPLLPAGSAWRFGAGMEEQIDKGLRWGAAVEYVYGGTLDINKRAALPVALGGRGDLVGSYNNTGILFVSAHANWTF
jgi:long-chain fatty acid transport protein